MGDKIRELLVRLGLYIASLGGYQHRLQVFDGIKAPRQDVLIEAARLVEYWERSVAPGTSGEYKRYQCYAELLKTFRAERKSELALAIELACLRRPHVTTVRILDLDHHRR